MGTGRARSPTLPHLRPGAAAIRLLARMPLAHLRAAANERGIAIPSRATRQQVASLLVLHTSRARAERQYRETGIAFSSRDRAYPHIRRLVTRYRLSRILDLGCGPGLFAAELAQGRRLRRDGVYIGLDVSPAAIELARGRFADDLRFTFDVEDAEQLSDRSGVEIDGIVISFALSYLDTHAVDLLMQRLAGMYPNATVIIALTFGSCVDPLEGVERDEARDLAAARRYLAGDTTAGEQIWDVRRLTCYRRSVEAYYRIVEERTLRPLAQMLWVARPRPRKRSGRKNRAVAASKPASRSRRAGTGR